MKQSILLFSLLFYLASQAHAQVLQPPCTLKARISIGICIDFFCIPLYGHVSGGTAPYRYQWFNGDEQQNSGLNFGADPNGLDTCLTLRVTDAKGCIAEASTRYIYSITPLPPQFYPDSTFLGNDTLKLLNGPATFDLGLNDHPYAQNYLLVQAPKHGTVSLNADGTGNYTPDADWCGPDNFRYTAADTSACHYGQMATVWVLPANCAGIISEKVDCNHSCQAAAAFYQQGLLTPPLSYLWSNGSTTETAEQLCEGPISVTVTDDLGTVETYNATIEGEVLQASISGPAKFCNKSNFSLGASINTQNVNQYYIYWSGIGFYGDLFYQTNPKVYCSAPGSTVEYQLRAYTDRGCETTTTHSLEVLKDVNIDLQAIVPKCPGDTIRMKTKFNVGGTGPYHYSWSGPAGVQSNWQELSVPDAGPQHSGYYYVTVNDVNGCSSSRLVSILIPDTCPYKIVILTENTPFCSGTDIPLQFGMSTNYIKPDEVTWTGPGGFVSHDLSPILHNSSPSMSGWYHLLYRLGNNYLQDSILLSVVPDALSFNALDITPPTSCGPPYDGKLSMTLSAAPPFQAKLDYNNFQNINVNPVVFNGVLPGLHMVTVKKNGCLATKNVLIPIPDLPQLQVQPESCAGNDGSLTLSSPHPLSVTWILPNGNWLNNNQLSLNNAVPGTYLIAMTDQTTHCSIKDTVTLAPYLDFDIAVLDTPNCTDANGVLQVIPNSGTVDPIAYLWNNGLTSNPATGLSEGGYSVTLTDGDGCSRHQNTVLPAQEACIAQVTGRVYANLNCICAADNQTVAFPFAKVCADDGVHKLCTFVSNTGDYNLALTEAGQYTISATSYLPGLQGVCTEQSFVVGNDLLKDTSGLNFFFCGQAETDLFLTGFSGPARPGFDHFSTFQVINYGFYISDSSRLNLDLSPYLANPIFSPQPESYDPIAHKASWKINKLLLFQQFKLEIRGTVVGNLGDTLAFDAHVISLDGTDSHLSNNVYKSRRIISGSFDPNDKEVEPLGVGNPGKISTADSVLTYTIRFQNTGTDTAFTVIVRDTIDTDVFDLNSVRPLLSSHPFQLDIERGNVLIFRFPNINLPDSNRTLPGSQGFVKFSIKLLPHLQQGTVISNTAAIYFDFNAPVITNAVENILVQSSSPESTPIQMLLLPNPASRQSLLKLSCPEGLKWLSVFLLDATGALERKLFEGQASGPELLIPVEAQDLPAGIYFVLVRSNLGNQTRKLVLMGR